MEAAINEFQPFKAPGPDGLYPVLLQKGWKLTERILPCYFLSMSETQLCSGVGDGGPGGHGPSRLFLRCRSRVKISGNFIFFGQFCSTFIFYVISVGLLASGGFRGGDGGMHPPSTSLKVTILAKKSASVSNNSAPFRDASPPTDLNVTNQFW